MIVAEIRRNNSDQEAVNGRLYRKANLVRTYSSTKLYPAEATAMIRYREDIEGRAVLDLGCGAGRLATYLRPLRADYVGVDISDHMVAHCRREFDGLPFFQGDIRDLSQFAHESFDCIIAISNLFDAVSHEDRLRVLAEVRRVMKPRALLIFSSHNRNYIHAGQGPKLRFHRNPLTQIRSLLEHFQASTNHRRIKPLQRFEADYALINDSGNNYVTLHYYVTRDVQARQLKDAGFDLIECLDECGYSLGANDDDQANSTIQYIARRPG